MQRRPSLFENKEAKKLYPLELPLARFVRQRIAPLSGLLV
jgi:hypothetical protein